VAKQPFGEYETQPCKQTTDAGARASHIYGGASTLAQDLMQKWVSELKDSGSCGLGIERSCGFFCWDTATCPSSSSPNGFGDGLILTSLKSEQACSHSLAHVNRELLGISAKDLKYRSECLGIR
jgi:hypothetical protein